MNDSNLSNPEGGSDVAGQGSAPASLFRKDVLTYAIIGSVVFALAAYLVMQPQGTVPSDDTSNVPEDVVANQEIRSAILGGLLKEDPVQLQNAFLDDVRAGTNDKYTKAAVYFIMHRFYDNGGNVYEIYDYVNSHPELAFLKEAEQIFPEYFGLVATKALPATYSDRGNMVIMAYLEVLDKYGYGDAALLSTLSNQYAKIALFLNVYARADESRRDFFLDLRETLLEKAQMYTAKAKPRIDQIVAEDSTVVGKELTAHDALVGVNQYASALRYLKTQNIQVGNIDHTKESYDKFRYSAELAQREVTELMSFTALIDASTLVIAGSRDTVEVDEALAPILAFDTIATPPFKNGAIDRVLSARDEEVSADMINRKLDVYSKTNVAGLAEVSPLFKEWLMKNGWTEEDFQVDTFILK